LIFKRGILIVLDGMADCSDSECCDDPNCRDHLMCMTANDPVEVLLRKQPPSVTSSFFPTGQIPHWRKQCSKLCPERWVLRKV